VFKSRIEGENDLQVKELSVNLNGILVVNRDPGKKK